jgi:hypothetical protein
MKTHGRVGIYIHVFLTSELVGGEWLASRSGRFTPGERAPDTHRIRGWLVSRFGLDDVEKRKFLTLQGLEFRPLRRQACSQSLYRLPIPKLKFPLILKRILLLVYPWERSQPSVLTTSPWVSWESTHCVVLSSLDKFLPSTRPRTYKLTSRTGRAAAEFGGPRHRSCFPSNPPQQGCHNGMSKTWTQKQRK